MGTEADDAFAGAKITSTIVNGGPVTLGEGQNLSEGWGRGPAIAVG